MEFLKKVKDNLWAVAVAIIGILFFLFRRESGKRVEAEGALMNAETKKEAAVIDNEVKHLNSSVEETSKAIAEVDKQKAELKAPELSPSEAESYWNKKK